MSQPEKIVTDRELEKVMEKYGFDSVVNQLKKRRTTSTPLWQGAKQSLSITTYQYQLEKMLKSSYKEMHKIHIRTLLLLIAKKLKAKIGRWIYRLATRYGLKP